MDLSHALLKKIKESSLLEAGDRVLIGVSGGVDSVVLLDLLVRLSEDVGLTISIAHVNYGLRGKESDRDEKFVKGLAKKYDCQLFLAKPKGLKNKSDNLQLGARNFRYKFFLDAAKKINADKIALAHHADDQAETVLLHLSRGAGLNGLTGMDSSRELDNVVKLVRPLLPITRKEILGYAKERLLKFVEDSTNKTNKYSRNFIRHDVLPLLSKANPNIVKSLCKTANILRDDDIALDSIAIEGFKKVVKVEKGKVFIQRKGFLKYPMAIRKRILRLAYNYLTGDTADLLTDHIEKMCYLASSLNKKAEYSLPHGLKFVRSDGVIFIKVYV